MADDKKIKTLEDIYRAYLNPLHNYLYRLSGDWELARDLVQEVFYRATRSLLYKREITHVAAWLYTIARNLYLDHARKSRIRNQPLGDETEFKDPSTDPQKILDNKELHTLIQKILLQLPESQRTVLILRDHLGLSYWEIAQITGKTVSSVKSSLFRGRLAFKELYTKEELEGG